MESEPFKSYTEVTIAGWVDKHLDKENVLQPSSAYLGKMKTAGQGCGFRASSGGSLEWQLKPWDSQLTSPGCFKGLHLIPCTLGLYSETPNMKYNLIYMTCSCPTIKARAKSDRKLLLETISCQNKVGAQHLWSDPRAYPKSGMMKYRSVV